MRIYRVKLAPGESLSEHTHSAGWIGVTIRGGAGPAAYQWYPANAPNPLRPGDKELEIVELEPR